MEFLKMMWSSVNDFINGKTRFDEK